MGKVWHYAGPGIEDLHRIDARFQLSNQVACGCVDFMHNGNGLNMVYVDPENDLVAVVRWIDNNAVDGFLKRLIAAVAEKS
jgi:hypothetical protein